MLAILAALVMAAVDARNRPVLASVAYGMTVFVTVSVPSSSTAPPSGCLSSSTFGPAA